MTDTTSRAPALTRTPVSRLAFWAFVGVAVVNVAANLADAAWPDGAAAQVANASQWLLMPLLALSLWFAVPTPRTRLVRFAVLGLGLSWLGDFAPDLVGSDAAFLVMMGFFALAQVAYIVAFWPLRRTSLATRPWALVGYGGVFVGLVVACAPGAGGLLGPMIIYGACLTIMALLATGLGRVAGIGGALFIVSDALIALRAFEVVDPPLSGFWVMATYIVAQALLAEAVARHCQSVNHT